MGSLNSEGKRNTKINAFLSTTMQSNIERSKFSSILVGSSTSPHDRTIFEHGNSLIATTVSNPITRKDTREGTNDSIDKLQKSTTPVSINFENQTSAKSDYSTVSSHGHKIYEMGNNTSESFSDTPPIVGDEIRPGNKNKESQNKEIPSSSDSKPTSVQTNLKLNSLDPSNMSFTDNKFATIVPTNDSNKKQNNNNNPSEFRSLDPGESLTTSAAETNEGKIFFPVKTLHVVADKNKSSETNNETTKSSQSKTILTAGTEISKNKLNPEESFTSRPPDSKKMTVSTGSDSLKNKLNPEESFTPGNAEHKESTGFTGNSYRTTERLNSNFIAENNSTSLTTVKDFAVMSNETHPSINYQNASTLVDNKYVTEQTNIKSSETTSLDANDIQIFYPVKTLTLRAEKNNSENTPVIKSSTIHNLTGNVHKARNIALSNPKETTSKSLKVLGSEDSTRKFVTAESFTYRSMNTVDPSEHTLSSTTMNDILESNRGTPTPYGDLKKKDLFFPVKTLKVENDKNRSGTLNKTNIPSTAEQTLANATTVSTINVGNRIGFPDDNNISTQTLFATKPFGNKLGGPSQRKEIDPVKIYSPLKGSIDRTDKTDSEISNVTTSVDNNSNNFVSTSKNKISENMINENKKVYFTTTLYSSTNEPQSQGHSNSVSNLNENTNETLGIGNNKPQRTPSHIVFENQEISITENRKNYPARWNLKERLKNNNKPELGPQEQKRQHNSIKNQPKKLRSDLSVQGIDYRGTMLSGQQTVRSDAPLNSSSNQGNGNERRDTPTTHGSMQSFGGMETYFGKEPNSLQEKSKESDHMLGSPKTMNQAKCIVLIM
jgi:ribosomal protein S18